MAQGLGDLETQLLAYVQLRGQSLLRSEEVAPALGISATQTRELLSRLARRKLIVRVRRGLYLAPTKFPPGGIWTPGEYLALAALMEDRGADYQICGPAAFQRYGWEEQVPQRLDVYNTAISGQRKVGTSEFGLIKVAAARIGDVELVRTATGMRVPYSSRARSLVDAIYDWSRFGSLPRAYEWLRTELRREPSFAGELTASALKFGNSSVHRRLGKLLELEGAAPRLLKRLESRLSQTSALIAWSPTRAKRGTVDRRWGVVFNG